MVRGRGRSDMVRGIRLNAIITIIYSRPEFTVLHCCYHFGGHLRDPKIIISFFFLFFFWGGGGDKWCLTSSPPLTTEPPTITWPFLLFPKRIGREPVCSLEVSWRLWMLTSWTALMARRLARSAVGGAMYTRQLLGKITANVLPPLPSLGSSEEVGCCKYQRT